jgi:hypothetical protein
VFSAPASRRSYWRISDRAWCFAYHLIDEGVEYLQQGLAFVPRLLMVPQSPLEFVAHRGMPRSSDCAVQVLRQARPKWQSLCFHE